MPLVKPEPAPQREGVSAWKDVEWLSFGAYLADEKKTGFDHLMKELLSHLQLQQSTNPTSTTASPSSTTTFRVLIKNLRIVIAIADELTISKDCLEIETVLGMLASEIEQGHLTIGKGEEEEELATLFRHYWNDKNNNPLQESIDDFEELIPTSSDSSPSSETSGDGSLLTFTQLNESTRRKIQQDIRRSRRGMAERRNKRFKWKHVKASNDDIELGVWDIAGEGLEGEKEILSEGKEKEKEKGGKEKEKEASGIGPAEKSALRASNEEWLWMEVPYSKEGNDEFWDIKEAAPYELPAVPVEEDSDFVNLGSLISEEFELSSDTPWKSRNKEGFRDEKRYQEMKAGFFSSKEAKVVASWNRVTIPHSRKESSTRLKDLIRNGIPDSKRGSVWLSVSGCNEYYDVYPNNYDDVVDRVFGTRIPKSFFQVPQFGGELRPKDHVLTAAGIECAQRILWALSMENPDIDYVPVIPDAVCIAVSFLKEGDAYTLVNSMIDQSRDDRWFFSLNNKKITLFLLTFQSLLQKYLPKLAAHIEFLGVDLVTEFADSWFKRLFVTTLPYQTVLRVFDVFVNEGSGILYRVALALLRVASVSLMGCSSRSQFLNTLQQICVQYQDADHLLRTAFRVTSLSRKELATHDSMNSPLLKSVREPEYKPFYRPKIDVDSAILGELQFEALWSLLPSRYSIMDPVLLFSTSKNGFSLKSLLEKCESPSSVPCVLLITDNHKRVFGAFASQGLKLHENYYGTTECFLFTLVPDVKKYGWLAGHKRYFCRVTTKGLFFGDSSGLTIDDELWHGSSQKCETYENEPLSGDDNDFDCVALEVIGFKGVA